MSTSADSDRAGSEREALMNISQNYRSGKSPRPSCGLLSRTERIRRLLVVSRRVGLITYCSNSVIQPSHLLRLAFVWSRLVSVSVRITSRPASLGAGSGARRYARVGRRFEEPGCGRSGCQRPRPRAWLATLRARGLLACAASRRAGNPAAGFPLLPGHSSFHACHRIRIPALYP
jgi:hypothetical protein